MECEGIFSSGVGRLLSAGLGPEQAEPGPLALSESYHDEKYPRGHDHGKPELEATARTSVELKADSLYIVGSEPARCGSHATDDADKTVPLLKAAKREGLNFEAVHPTLFGCPRSQLTKEISALYERSTARAAEKSYNPATIAAGDFFQKDDV